MRDLTNGAKGHKAADVVGGMVARKTQQGSGSLAESVDPWLVALALGVDEVVTVTSLEESGRVEYVGEKLRILVRASDPAPRQRFTVAHELGHVLFGFQAAGYEYSDDEERRCNRFAAGLLMPRRIFKAAFEDDDGAPLAQHLVNVAARFEVSPAAAFARLSELSFLDRAQILLDVRGGGRGSIRRACHERSLYQRLAGMSLERLGIHGVVDDLRRTSTLSSRARVRLPTRGSKRRPGGLSVTWAIVSLAPVSTETSLIGIEPIVHPVDARLLVSEERANVGLHQYRLSGAPDRR